MFDKTSLNRKEMNCRYRTQLRDGRAVVISVVNVTVVNKCHSQESSIASCLAGVTTFGPTAVSSPPWSLILIFFLSHFLCIPVDTSPHVILCSFTTRNSTLAVCSPMLIRVRLLSCLHVCVVQKNDIDAFQMDLHACVGIRTHSVGVAMCPILPALRAGTHQPTDASIRTSSNACPTLLCFRLMSTL